MSTTPPDEQERVPDESPTPPSPVAVPEIEVPVQFALESTTTTLGQLQSLQAGYIFELTEKADAPVTILVHGTPCGRGEMVRVGDRIGVRVTEVLPHANHTV